MKDRIMLWRDALPDVRVFVEISKHETAKPTKIEVKTAS